MDRQEVSLRRHVIQRVYGLRTEDLASVNHFLDGLDAQAVADIDLKQVAKAVGDIQADRATETPRPDWPHAPCHRISGTGTYIVTGSTLHKEHLFRHPERLDLLQAALLSVAEDFGWQLEAWAVFSNHYHFVAHSQPDSRELKDLLSVFHTRTASTINRIDQQAGRNVWFNYWDTKLTFERSYLARLNYVHQNPVRHGLVSVANEYPWCSASWFERTARRSQVQTIYSFKIDRVNVRDDFDVIVE